MKKIGDLKDYLKQQGMSPEQLAPRVRISNMTLRRLLKRPDSTPIPSKYLLQLETLQLNLSSDRDLTDYLTRQAASNESVSEAELRGQLDEKFKHTSVDPSFREHMEFVLKQAFAPKNSSVRLIAIGAILYVINPFDLVPDFAGVVGLIDDFGVLAFAAQLIRNRAG